MMSLPSWLGTHWLPTQYLEWIFQGVCLTLLLALSVCGAATLLGTVLTALHANRYAVVRGSTQAVLSIHRNTPLIVQLFLWYFGVASILPGHLIEWFHTPHIYTLPFHLSLRFPSFEVLAAFIALTLYSACFISSEISAGLRGVKATQKEAAYALGMTSWQTFYSVIWPQALVLVRRPLIGQYAIVVKDTSLAMVIGVAELSYRVRQVESETLLAFQAFAIATLLYLMITLFLQYKGQEKITAWKLPR
jgi:polar amino acid transport system permease protein